MAGYDPHARRAADAARQREVDDRVAAARAKVQGGATSPVPHAPGTPPPPAPVAAGPNAVKGALKGAVKVTEFPDQSKYPFRAIADDGGIWKLNPAVFSVKATGIKQAALKWAQNHRLKVKVAIDGGDVYLQFSKAEP